MAVFPKKFPEKNRAGRQVGSAGPKMATTTLG
jgi:hypothetical protein